MAKKVLKTNKKSKEPMSFQEVGELPSKLAVLIYGRSGTGKTTIAGTFPKPLLLLDINEKGTDSISNIKGIKVGNIEDWQQFEDVYWYLKEGDHPYKTVVIDQITQLQDLALRKVMKDDGKDENDQVSKRNFGQASGLMKTWLSNYRDLIDSGLEVLFLSHDRITSNDDDGDDDQIDPTVGPRVMPSVASFLNGAVKMIGNTFIKEEYSIENKRKVRRVRYCMRIGPHSYYTTKTRSPAGIESPDIIVNPTYEKMLSVLKGTYKEEEKPKGKKLNVTNKVRRH